MRTECEGVAIGKAESWEESVLNTHERSIAGAMAKDQTIQFLRILRRLRKNSPKQKAVRITKSRV